MTAGHEIERVARLTCVPELLSGLVDFAYQAEACARQKSSSVEQHEAELPDRSMDGI